MMHSVSTKPGNTCVVNIPDDYAPIASRQWLTLNEGRDKGKKLYYSDEIVTGDGVDKHAIEDIFFFVHGNPESSYTYRKVTQGLREYARAYSSPLRIITVDHIGFGLSDQASFEMVDCHHADNLSQLLTHLQLDIHKVHLTVHDWGGPIGIGAFLKEKRPIKSLTILNTTIFPIPQDGATYENFPLKKLPWSKSVLLPDALWGAHAGFAVTQAGRLNSKAMLPKYLEYQIRSSINKLPEGDRDAQQLYIQQFSSTRNVRSSKRMVMQTPVWGHGYSYVCPVSKEVFNNTAFYTSMQETIATLWQSVSVAMVLGAVDPLAKASVTQQWIAALPQLADNIQVYPKDSHFIAETRSKEILSVLTNRLSTKPLINS